MPIYEYICPKCGTIEVIQKFSDDPLSFCPTCEEKGEKNKVEKAISRSAFHLKGTGWYKTDYSSSNTPKNTSTTSSASEGAKEAKTEAKTDSETKSTEPSSPSKKCGGGCTCH